ncbi:MAG: hypothetical protein ACRDHZ_01415 [Ktedonobacteraceae bacterium]
MTQGQGKPTSLHCPRCGGLMHKATGSTLYWHVDNNHPRCDITNIVEKVLEVQLTAVDTPTPEPSKPAKGQRKK